MYQDYTASTQSSLLTLLARYVGDKSYTAPSFIDAVYPKEAKQDERSGNQIVEDLIKKLKE